MRDEVLKRVDQSLGELQGLIDRAAAERCDVIALPEDTLGLGTWEAGNEALAKEVLPRAVERMLARLGAAAAKHQIYVICCNDFVESRREHLQHGLLHRARRQRDRPIPQSLPDHPRTRLHARAIGFRFSRPKTWAASGC